MIKDGATIWARQTIDSQIFFSKPDKWFKIWFYIVSKVNHKDNKKHNIKRGENIFSYSVISEITGATKSEIDHCLRFLRKNQQVATRRATRKFIITVLNYDVYQSLGNYKSDSKSDRKAIEKRLKSDTIYKNEKNEKNEKNIYISFIKKFNEIKNSKFLGNDKVKNQLKARLKDGYTLEEIIKATEICFNDDYHKKNTKYLTPEFITRADKLEMYFNYNKSNKTSIEIEEDYFNY